MANYITTDTSNPSQSNIVTTANVHIGGAGNPAQELQVTGDGVFTGNITAYYSSDINLKDNIRPIESAIFKVKQIRGVTFDWNEKSNKLQQEKGHDVGLIAQEVEKDFPSLVGKMGDGYKGIRYDRMVPVLIDCIKTQDKKIERLENLVERLINKSEVE